MQKNIFEQESIPKLYFRLTLPLVLSLVVTLVYNLADTFFVAQTGNTDLVAGVSLCAPVFTMIMALGNIFGQGGSALISRLLGKNERESIRSVSAFCFYAAILTGVLFGGVMLLFGNPIITLLGASAKTRGYALEYYSVMAVGAPAVVLSFIHTNLLRSEGLSKESMIGSVGGTAVNIILDPIMISVWGWGARGAAIATVIGYLFTDLFLLLIVLRRSRILSVNIAKAKISGHFLSQILGIGVSAAVVNILQSICLILLNQSLLPYGDIYIAAMGIVQKASMIVQLVLVGLSFGSQPMFGYFYGAGDRQKLRGLYTFCCTFITITAVVLTALICIFAPNLIRVFMQEQEIVDIGASMLRWQVISMVCVGYILLGNIVFQSFGKVKEALFLSLSRQGYVFIIILAILTHVAGYQGILMSQAVSDVIAAGITAVLLHRIRRPAYDRQEEACSGK